MRLQNCGMSPASIIVTKDLHLSYGIQSSLVQYKLSDIGEGIREVSIKEWFVRLVITLPSLIQSVRCRVTRHQLQLQVDMTGLFASCITVLMTQHSLVSHWLTLSK